VYFGAAKLATAFENLRGHAQPIGAAARTNLTGTVDRFEQKVIDFDRHALLQHADIDDQPRLLLAAEHHAFDADQRPLTHADALPRNNPRFDGERAAGLEPLTCGLGVNCR